MRRGKRGLPVAREAVAVRVDASEPRGVELVLFRHDAYLEEMLSPVQARKLAASLVRAADAVDVLAADGAPRACCADGGA